MRKVSDLREVWEKEDEDMASLLSGNSKEREKFDAFRR